MTDAMGEYLIQTVKRLTASECRVMELEEMLAAAREALEFYANKDNLDDFDAPGHCLAKMTTAQRHALGAPMAEDDPRREHLLSEHPLTATSVHWVCDLGDIARNALAKLEAPADGK